MRAAAATRRTSPADGRDPFTVDGMTTLNPFLASAAIAMPPMTPSQKAEAWDALTKITASGATVNHTAAIRCATDVVAAGKTHAAALAAAGVDDRRAQLAAYFGIPVPGGAP